MWEFMQKGGPIMWPILLCSVIAFSIVIERLIRLKQEQIDTKSFMEQISKSLKRNKIMEALDLCERTGGPIANILRAGILKHDRPRAEVREAIEDASIHEVPRLERNLPVLNTIAQAAPLLPDLSDVVRRQLVGFDAGALKDAVGCGLGIVDLQIAGQILDEGEWIVVPARAAVVDLGHTSDRSAQSVTVSTPCAVTNSGKRSAGAPGPETATPRFPPNDGFLISILFAPRD